jgi:hypothetical protein
VLPVLEPDADGRVWVVVVECNHPETLHRPRGCATDAEALFPAPAAPDPPPLGPAQGQGGHFADCGALGGSAETHVEPRGKQGTWRAPRAVMIAGHAPGAHMGWWCASMCDRVHMCV